MAAVPFDTLKLATKLETGGFTSAQARTAAEALSQAIGAQVLATRKDMEAALREAEQRITIKTGAMLIALAGFLAAIKFFG